jgi:sulfate adenylyltransferase
MHCSAAVAAPVATNDGLQAPHGGALVNLMVPADQVDAVVASCTKIMDLSHRNACDVELLAVG